MLTKPSRWCLLHRASQEVVLIDTLPECARKLNLLVDSVRCRVLIEQGMEPELPGDYDICKVVDNV